MLFKRTKPDTDKSILSDVINTRGNLDYVKNGVVYKNSPIKTVLVRSELEIFALSDKYEAGTIAYTAGFNKIWQLKANGAWVDVSDPSEEVVVEDYSKPQKDVNFIDYDGTIVYSYTADEFDNLPDFPLNPSHSGLESQGWNWTLEDAKAYVKSHGRLWIGQMYITDTKQTRIYVRFDEGRLSPMLGVGVNGTVDVDWGDGTAHDTLTGTGVGTTKFTPVHNYAKAGNYVIKLSVYSGTIRINYAQSISCLLRKSSLSNNINYAYLGAINKIEIGDYVSIDQYGLAGCENLKSITLRKNTYISSNAFRTCRNLKSVVFPQISAISNGTFYSCASLSSIAIPNNVERVEPDAFMYCNGLSDITIPDGVWYIGDSAFKNSVCLRSVILPNSLRQIYSNTFISCTMLSSIVIPSRVQTIGSDAFAFNHCLGFIKFESSTPPTVSNSDTWTNLPTDCIIYVPEGSLSAYTSAANYPDPNTYTYVEY